MANYEIKEKITGSGYIAVKGGTFGIDGIPVASPTGINFEEHTLSRSWDDATGIMHKINLRLRRKVVWVYDVIGFESMQEIFNILNNKRVKKASTRYSIDTWYLSGQENMIVEWGTPWKSECIDGNKNLYRCELSFIEPIGIDLQANLEEGSANAME